MSRLTLAAALGLLLLLPRSAAATPHDLPYSYPYATLAEGALEVEEYVDLTPVPVINSAGATVTNLGAVLTTEIEYGLTDRLEAGFYVELSNDTLAEDGTVPAQIDGIKERLRYRIADEGALPIDISVYGELAEFVSELELEAKVNLQKRLGPALVLVNLWAEREFYYNGQQEWVLNPTGGVTFELSPSIHLGVEYWGHGEFGLATAGAFNPAFHSYLGPALMMQKGRVWIAAAPYLRLDRLGRTAQVGDQYGPVWVRTIVGVEF